MDYHNHTYTDHSFLIYKNDKLISLFPANIIGDKIFSHSGLTYGGLVLPIESKFTDVLNILRSLLINFSNNDIKNVLFKITPNIYSTSPSSELDYILFKVGSKLIKRDLMSVINLENYHISKDRINGYKRGLKSNLVIKEVSDFEDFWNNLLSPNLLKKYSVSPVHSCQEISLLKSRFAKNIRQFNVYYLNKLVAGTTIFETKTTAHVQYTASNDLKNKTGSLDYLFYSLIKNEFKNKQFFDFGISNIPGSNLINEGLLYWKEGFGSRSITHDFYEISTSCHSDLNHLIKEKPFYDLLD